MSAVRPGALAPTHAGLMLLLIATLAGCRLTAPDTRPDSPGAPEKQTAAPAIPEQRWWELFGEPELAPRIDEALRNNPDVMQTLARVREARARLAVADAGFYPTARANASGTRGTRSSNTGAGNQGVGENYSASGTLAYEVDLWGRARNLSDAAHADYRASVGDWESARITLVAEMLSTWYAWRAAVEERDILKRQIGYGVESHNAAYTRMVMGAAAEDAVERAKYDLARLRIDLVDAETRIDSMRRAFIILMGAEWTRTLPAPIAGATRLPALPESVSSSALMNRPDIFAADKRISAALLREGATRADYYPNLTLTATGGFTSDRTSSFTDSGSRFWNLGPSVSLPLFTGFKTDADMELAKAEFERSWAVYKKTVLTAFKEVEDTLADLRDLNAKSKLLAEQSEASGRTRSVILKKYSLGAASAIDVSIAERDYMDTQRAAVKLNLDRANKAVQLVKATGGGRPTPKSDDELNSRLGTALDQTQATGFAKTPDPVPTGARGGDDKAVTGIR